MIPIKNNTIAVYIFSKAENYWNEYKNVYVSSQTIDQINERLIDSLVINTKDIDHSDNYSIYQRTKKSVLWLSTEPEDVITTDLSIFWLPEADYNKAVDIIYTKILN